jgi:hypothetical protein
MLKRLIIPPCSYALQFLLFKIHFKKDDIGNLQAAMLSELMGEIWLINRVSLSHNHSPLQACKAARPCTKLK